MDKSEKFFDKVASKSTRLFTYENWNNAENLLLQEKTTRNSNYQR